MRVIDTDLADPAFTAALDETILETALAGGPPTLHLYRRSPASITMGYFLKARENVDLDYCTENNIKVIRRISGGGAIFTDERQLVYCLAAKDMLPEAPATCFSIVLSELAHTLSELGCECQYSPVNDVLVGDRKISGSAIVNKGATKIIHGTILVDIDRDVMFKALKVSGEKVRTKGLGGPGDRVTSLTEVIGGPVQMGSVKDAVIKAMSTSIGQDPHLGTLTDDELLLAKELVRTKYGTDEWNLKY
jgi:lipoate-protein ligase A